MHPLFVFTPFRTPRRSHQLRYVLRNKTTGAVYLVIVFTLYLKEDLNEDGTLIEGAEPRPGDVDEDDDDDDDDDNGDGKESKTKYDAKAVLAKAKEKLGKPTRETSADDVD